MATERWTASAVLGAAADDRIGRDHMPATDMVQDAGSRVPRCA